MQHLKNLKKYTPDDENSLLLIKEHNVEFYISEDGRDWYESQADFSPDTLKIAYDESGIIRSISRDVSSIYPRNLSIVALKVKMSIYQVDGFLTTVKLNHVNIHKRNYAYKLKRRKLSYCLSQL